MGYITGIKTQSSVKDTGFTSDKIFATYMLSDGGKSEMSNVIVPPPATYAWGPPGRSIMLARTITLYMKTPAGVDYSSKYGSIGPLPGGAELTFALWQGVVPILEFFKNITTMNGWLEVCSNYTLAIDAGGAVYNHFIQIDLQEKFGSIYLNGTNSDKFLITINSDLSVVGVDSQKIKIYGVSLT